MSTRRQVAAGLGGCMAVLATASGRAQPTGEYADGWRILRAGDGQARLRGSDAHQPRSPDMTGVTPGPLLRIKRGEELRVRLVNELTDRHDDPLARRCGCRTPWTAFRT